MNDNQPPGQRGRGDGRTTMPLLIVGRIGPGDTVIFDDPEMLVWLRRQAQVSARRAQIRAVED